MSSVLTQLGSPEDCVNGYVLHLLKKRKDGRTRESILLGSVLEGSRPFWPLLLRVFKNYLHDLERGRVNPIDDPGPVDPGTLSEQDNKRFLPPVKVEPDEPALPFTDRDLLLRNYKQRLTRIRDAWPIPPGNGVYYRGVLLLRNRCDLMINQHNAWIEQIAREPQMKAGPKSVSDPDAIQNAVASEAAKAIAPFINDIEDSLVWEEFEKAHNMLRGDPPTLQATWETCKSRLLDPPYQLDFYAVAELIGVQRNTWDQWCSRAERAI